MIARMHQSKHKLEAIGQITLDICNQITIEMTDPSCLGSRVQNALELTNPQIAIELSEHVSLEILVQNAIVLTDAQIAIEFAEKS